LPYAGQESFVAIFSIFFKISSRRPKPLTQVKALGWYISPFHGCLFERQKTLPENPVAHREVGKGNAICISTHLMHNGSRVAELRLLVSDDIETLVRIRVLAKLQ